MKRKLLPILILFTCLLPLVWLLREQKFSLLLQLDIPDILRCALLIVAGYLVSGLQYRLVLKRLGCTIDPVDILFFPFMQSFWGILIPFQGTTLFALFYLKVRYSFQMRESAAMVLFLYLFNFIFGSIAGIIYSIFHGNCWSLLFLFSTLSLFTPLYLWVAHRILERVERIPLLPERIQVTLKLLFASLHSLSTNPGTMTCLMFFQILRQFCYSAILVILAGALGIKSGWLWGYLVVVGQELSVLVKFTPGNLGIAEMAAGVVSRLTGVPVVDGISVSLLLTLLQMILIILIGLLGNYFFIRKLKLSWREMFQRFRSSEHP